VISLCAQNQRNGRSRYYNGLNTKYRRQRRCRYCVMMLPICRVRILRKITRLVRPPHGKDPNIPPARRMETGVINECYAIPGANNTSVVPAAAKTGLCARQPQCCPIAFVNSGGTISDRVFVRNRYVTLSA